MWSRLATAHALTEGTAYADLLDLRDDLEDADASTGDLDAWLDAVDRVVAEVMGIKKDGQAPRWAVEAVHLDAASRHPVGKGWRPSFAEWAPSREITLTVSLSTSGTVLSPTDWTTDREAAHRELDRLFDEAETVLRSGQDDADVSGNVGGLETLVRLLPSLRDYLAAPPNRRPVLPGAERTALRRLAMDDIDIDFPRTRQRTKRRSRIAPFSVR